MIRRCCNIFLIGSALLLVSCSAWIELDQPKSAGQAASLTAAHNLGQTFVAQEAGLAGLQIFLAPQTNPQGEIHLHLRTNPQATEDLATSILPVTTVTAPDFYRFNFSPQAASRHQAFYILLELKGSGSLGVGNAEGDSYLDGAFYQAGVAQDSQLAFHLVYEPWLALGGLIGEMFTWGKILGIGVCLFILPGWALLSLVGSGSGALAWPEKVGLAAGLSLAVYPLLFLWTNLIGLHLGPGYGALPVLVGGGILIWQGRHIRPAAVKERWQAWWRSDAFKPEVAWLWAVGLIFLVRFLVIRSLPAPLGGDSYQHTLIAQLLVDHGGLFDSWQPYADVQSFTYHFGFHAATAVFHWASGLSVMEAVLWTGQLLNGLAVLALYPLTIRAGGNRWAGVGAVVFAGLLLPMPMSYVNWGRYTQLAGQVILPGAIWLFWTALSAEVRSRCLLVLTGVAWSGLALTHYRVFIFAVLFGVTYLLLESRGGKWRERLARTFGAGLGTALLAGPWFIHLFGGRIMAAFIRLASTSAQATSVVAKENNTLEGFLAYLPPLVAIALGLSCLWGLWQRKRGWTLVSLWWLLLIFVTNPHWLRLPGEGIVNNFAYLIAVYIPMGVLGGLAVTQLIDRWGSHYRTVIFWSAAVGLGVMGSYVRLGDFQPAERGLVTYPDLRAAAWIQKNTPLEARFLVNSSFAYGTAIAPGDAGIWLPLLSQRRSSVPPLISGFEQSVSAEDPLRLKTLITEIQNKNVADSHVLTLLRQQGFNYVYIGQRNGRGAPLLHAEALLASPDFKLLYHQDRVWIFQVAPQSVEETQ